MLSIVRRGLGEGGYIVSAEDARITGWFEFTPTFIYIYENALASIKTTLNANSLSYEWSKCYNTNIA